MKFVLMTTTIGDSNGYPKRVGEYKTYAEALEALNNLDRIIYWDAWITYEVTDDNRNTSGPRETGQSSV